MRYLARIALGATLLLPLAAGSAAAQVWVPGTPPPQNRTQQQQPDQLPGPGQTAPDQQGPYPDQQGQDPQAPRVVWPPQPGVQPPQPTAQPSAGLPAAASADAAPEPVVMPAPKDKDSRLSDEERLELIRYVSGEFAKARTALPGGKKAFHLRAGQQVDQKALLKALQDNGVAASPGDPVQITKLDFGGSDITVEINGGGSKGRSWRDHIQVMGGTMAPVQSSSTVDNTYGAPAASQPRPGITLQLDFERPLPEMSADELKAYLSAALDFSKQRSAAVQWTDSQPPAIREAIAQKRAALGMDEDQVMAAMGRADRKVREKEPDGSDVEDWIYGTPPGKTVFVRFAHEKVIRISQYPLPAGGSSEE